MSGTSRNTAFRGRGQEFRFHQRTGFARQTLTDLPQGSHADHRKGSKRRNGMVNNMLSMTDFDRLLLGFDRFHTAMTKERTINYPRYNIVRGKNQYRIEMDLAGWDKKDIEVILDQEQLTIKGVEKQGLSADESYVHRGISGKTFRRLFTLGEHIEVSNASFKDGMLLITLVEKLPDEKKPKLIDIN